MKKKLFLLLLLLLLPILHYEIIQCEYEPPKLVIEDNNEAQITFKVPIKSEEGSPTGAYATISMPAQLLDISHNTLEIPKEEKCGYTTEVDPTAGVRAHVVVCNSGKKFVNPDIKQIPATKNFFKNVKNKNLIGTYTASAKEIKNEKQQANMRLVCDKNC